LRYDPSVAEPSKPDGSFGKLLLRRRSPDTSITLATLAFAAIVLPLLATNAETALEWITLVVAGIPFPLFVAYSIAVRLEIFERVVRVRKVWGTRVIQLSQLESFHRQQSSSATRARLTFRPREGRIIRVTVESDAPDDELQAVLEGVARHAPSRPP